MKKIYFILFILLQNFSFGAVYYVSVLGSDTNPGSLVLPFKTITKAVSVVVAGDIIYLRGGAHPYAAKINITKNGTATNKIYLMAYPGDARPVLDFSSMPITSTDRGVQLSGTYWVIKGIDFYKSRDNGMHIDGANNIIEFCSFYENADTGLQLSNGANNNQIINCDSYFNKDATDGNADGFAAKLDVGTGNSFKGCRAWQNSDDGWDGLLSSGLGSNPATTYDSCWCFLNGYLKAGNASLGNGNGFKMGGNNEKHDATLTRCLSAFNRVKGFDQNNNNGSMILYNCTGYKNNPNFGMNNNDPSIGKVMVVKNSISFASSSTDVFRTVCVRNNNSWQINSFAVSNADFLSVDSVGLRNPRNADGSLPSINFMKLASSSRMVDAGINVGLPYNGAAPDLGAFETQNSLPVSLFNYEAKLLNKNVVLSWSTNNEINNSGWEIEKIKINSNNPFIWQKIGFVNGVANSNSINKYTFIDSDILLGNTYQYRLKQIDKSGAFKYSTIVLVKNTKALFSEVSIYPNPTQANVVINFNVPIASIVNANLYNENGQLISTIFSEKFEVGCYSRNYQFNNLANGNYTLQIVSHDGVINKTITKIN